MVARSDHHCRAGPDAALSRPRATPSDPLVLVDGHPIERYVQRQLIQTVGFAIAHHLTQAGCAGHLYIRSKPSIFLVGGTARAELFLVRSAHRGENPKIPNCDEVSVPRRGSSSLKLLEHLAYELSRRGAHAAAAPTTC